MFPDFLPREEERYFLEEEDIPEEMRDNPNARRFFKKIGEQIEIVPLQLKVWIKQHPQHIIQQRVANVWTFANGSARPSD